MNYIQVKAKHWWYYLNPFWYRRRRIMEVIINHYIEEKQFVIDEMVKNALLFGTGAVVVSKDGDVRLVDWADHRHKNIS